MTMKQTKSKEAAKPAKAPKTVATAKPARTRKRDPRLPAAGTTLTRKYKGKEVKVTVLEDGFRYDGREFRSLTALAQEITGYPAISGPAWFGLAGSRAAGTSKPETAVTTPPILTKARDPKAAKGAGKVRRAGRDPQPVPVPDAAPEPVPATETPTA